MHPKVLNFLPWLTAFILGSAFTLYLALPLFKSNYYKTIISLELSFNTEKVKSIIAEWSNIIYKDGRTLLYHARIGIYWDFLFIFIYAGFLFNVLLQLGPPTKWTILAAYASILAGVLDSIENIGMLGSLRGKANSINSIITATAAYTKFGLLIVAICTLLWIIIRLIIK